MELPQPSRHRFSVAEVPTTDDLVYPNVPGFRITQFLGETQYAQLYRGVNTDSSMPVAIKHFTQLPDPEEQEQQLAVIRREIRLTCQIGHPGVGRFLQLVKQAGDRFVVYEFSQHGWLADLVRDDSVTEEELCKLLFQILTVLSFLHAQDIIHRDINPQNLFRAADGQIKLWNFWSAISPQEPEHPFRPTSLSLEPLVDIWALGFAVIEIMTGVPPEETPGIPEHVSAEFRDLLESMMCESGRKSADELLEHPLIRQAGERIKEDAARQNGGDSEKVQMVGTYRMMEQIGEGAYGIIYRAVNVLNGIPVAIKRFDGLSKRKASDRNSILQEIDMMKTISHPFIVKYFSTIEEPDAINVVLEFAARGSLAHVMDEGTKPFGETSLMRSYVSQLIRGVMHLHKQGIVHRDIKADNIFLDNYGTIRIGDLGAAVKDGAKIGDFVEGSPYWMAPEVFDMDAPVSKACDVWGIGCTVIELVEGRPPYYGMDPMKAMMKIAQSDHPPLPQGISAGLRDFLLECFVLDPSKRMTCEQLLEHEWMTMPILEASAEDLVAMEKVRKYSTEDAIRKSRSQRAVFDKSKLKQKRNCRQS